MTMLFEKKVEKVIKSNSLKEEVKVSSKVDTALIEGNVIEDTSESEEKKKHTENKKELRLSIDDWNSVFTKLDLDAGTKPVSYTHLTLPTKA